MNISCFSLLPSPPERRRQREPSATGTTKRAKCVILLARCLPLSSAAFLNGWLRPALDLAPRYQCTLISASSLAPRPTRLTALPSISSPARAPAGTAAAAQAAPTWAHAPAAARLQLRLRPAPQLLQWHSPLQLRRRLQRRLQSRPPSPPPLPPSRSSMSAQPALSA